MSIAIALQAKWQYAMPVASSHLRKLAPLRTTSRGCELLAELANALDGSIMSLNQNSKCLNNASLGKPLEILHESLTDHHHIKSCAPAESRPDNAAVRRMAALPNDHDKVPPASLHGPGVLQRGLHRADGRASRPVVLAVSKL